jgi:hypothetical protein
MSISSTALLDVQELLEQGFQEGYTICEKLPRLLHDRVASAAPGEIDPAGVKVLLARVLNELYIAMARNLFAVLCRLETERGGSKPINFYFWPGYASVFLNRRVYYKAEEIAGMDPRFRDVGVGLFGSKLENSERYHYSSQSRYYHYAWKQPPDLADYTPGSVYVWFRDQRPRIFGSDGHEQDLIASFTVTTSPDLAEQDLSALDERRGSDGFLSRYQFLRIYTGPGDERPTSWGQAVADKLNGEMRRHVTDPSLEFPFSEGSNRPGKKSAALSLLSLWLHSAFSEEPPAWMSDLEKELDAEGFQKVREQLRQAASDDVAQKGWDAGKRRTRFVDWTTISLHPMLSPAALTNKEYYERSKTTNYQEQRALGSSVFLSSCVLGKEFISLVRPWMRSLYGMVRNAEMLVLSHNEMVQTSRSLAMIAGPWFAHEMNALLNKNTLMRAQLGKCDEQSVALRRIILNTAQSVSSLAYSATAAVLQPNAESFNELKEKFQEPLRSLAAGPGLKDALMAVARTVYHDVRLNRNPAENGIIPSLSEKHSDIRDLRNHDIGVCFLLVNEVISNHVRHSERETAAEFSITETGPHVTILLEADVSNETLPKSKTLTYLDELLKAFSLGGATTSWVTEKKRFRTSIEVTIAARTQERAPAQPMSGVPSR